MVVQDDLTRIERSGEAGEFVEAQHLVGSVKPMLKGITKAEGVNPEAKKRAEWLLGPLDG